MAQNHRSFIGYDDQTQRADLYTSITITANGAGSAVAANPVTNLIDAASGTLWRRNGVPHNGIVQVDLTLLVNVNAAERPSAAALVVANAYAVRQGTSERHPVQIRVRTYDNGFLTLGYDGRINPFVPYGYSSGRFPINYPFVVVGRGGSAQDLDDQDDGGRYLAGGTVGQGVRVDFIMPNAPTGTFDIFCERILYQRGLWCTLTPGISATYDDPTVVRRSYSGRPYATPKPVRTSLGFNMVNIDHQMAYGGLNEDGNFQRSTVHTVNRVAGIAGLVTVVPELTSSPVSGETKSEAVTPDTACMVGLMNAPMALEHVSAIASVRRALYRSSLQVTSAV